MGVSAGPAFEILNACEDSGIIKPGTTKRVLEESLAGSTPMAVSASARKYAPAIYLLFSHCIAAAHFTRCPLTMILTATLTWPPRLDASQIRKVFKFRPPHVSLTLIVFSMHNISFAIMHKSL